VCPRFTVVCAAALGGPLAVLQWLHGNGCPWDKDTCMFAATYVWAPGCAAVAACQWLPVRFDGVSVRLQSMAMVWFNSYTPPHFGRGKRRGRRPPEAEGARRGATPRATHGSLRARVAGGRASAGLRARPGGAGRRGAQVLRDEISSDWKGGVTRYYGMVWYGWCPSHPLAAIGTTRWWHLDRVPAARLRMCIIIFHMGHAHCHNTRGDWAHTNGCPAEDSEEQGGA
jgi:hypothetical protein